jgi:uncharacterized membrane protein YdcZ (DUF606 family)
MKESLIVAVLVALGSGLAIGTQSTLTGWAGRLVGPVRAGLLINLAGGALAALILLTLMLVRFPSAGQAPTRSVVMIVVVAGALGIGIIAGIAFALPRVGVAAGLATIIFGQMLVALVVDTLGWAGAAPIPLRLERLAGLGFLLAGTWLILPRT